MAESTLSPSHFPSEPPMTSINPPSEHELQLERQAVRKLDYTILPIMTIFYFLSFLDRVNIGNARVAGLQKDLHLTDRQYQICITVLYVYLVFHYYDLVYNKSQQQSRPYIATELPSNLLLRKIGPSLLLSTLLTLWGIMVTLQGLVSSYAGLATVRVFLGLVEGPMAPGIVLYLSGFYTRKELSVRIAYFFSAASFAGAFSGLLAAAIENMDGIGGRPGWAWIFTLEGLFSVLMGLLGYLVVPATPRDSKFLSENEKDIIMSRLERDRPSIKPVDKFTYKEVIRSVSSPHVIMLFLISFMVGMLLYGLALFLPSIVNQLGFSPNNSQLLSVGPFVGGFIVSLLSAYLSDHYESRGFTSAVLVLLPVAGFALYLGAEQKFTSYGALYLMVPGVFGSVAIGAAWVANNSEPYYRRATSVAISTIGTNAGGILSTWSFPTNEGPKFRKTTIINLVFSILIIVLALVNVAYLSWRNKVKKRPEERAKLLAKYCKAKDDADDGGGGLDAWMELGDRHPDFVYTL